SEESQPELLSANSRPGEVVHHVAHPGASTPTRVATVTPGRNTQLTMKDPCHHLRVDESRRAGDPRDRPVGPRQEIHASLQAHPANFIGWRASHFLQETLFQRTP